MENEYADYAVVFPFYVPSNRDVQQNQLGTVFYFTYEEMVELFAAGRSSTHGNEALESMKRKADIVFRALPVTDY